MKKNSLFLLLVPFALFGVTNSLFAQWAQTNGPSAGRSQVNALCAGGTTIYAAVSASTGSGHSGRVYCSTNNGENWVMVNNGLPADSVIVLAADSERVFAGTSDGRVFLSTDQGTIWTIASHGLPNVTVNVILIDSTGVFAGTGKGLFKSTNNGTNWISVNSGLTDSVISALASASTRIYAGTGNGLFLSTNGGLDWKRIDSSPVTSSIESIALNLAGIFVSDGSSVFRSSDGGSSWMEKDSGIPPGGSAGKLTIINDTTIFAGVNGLSGGPTSSYYFSTNNGESWQFNQGLEFNGYYTTTFVVSGKNIYAGTLLTGVWRSTDNGNSWISVNSGFVTGPVEAMAASGNEVLAGTFITMDQGTTWTQNDSGFSPGVHGGGPSVKSLAFNYPYAFAVGDGIFRSTNAGVHWTLQDSATAFSPYGSIVFIGSNIFATTTAGVSASYDNGVSWHAADSGLFSQNVALTADVYPPIVCSLAASGTNIFAGTYGSGIFESTDLGASWARADSGLPLDADTMVTAMTACGQNVFAYVDFYAIYLSTDKGTSWTQVNGGPRGDFESLGVSDTNVFLGAHNGGVFIFKSSNRTWLPENTGLLDNQVYSLATSNGELYAGTVNSGVWKRPVAEMVIDAVRDGKADIPSQFHLYQNYPNPFNPTTLIKYELQAKSFVTLKIYDVLGREVKTLVDERQTAGTHSITFKASNLPSGVYFYRLSAGSLTGQAGTYSKTKKLMVLK